MELNQFRNVDVVLDKANDNIIQKQFVSTGDKDGRSLTVQLTDNGAIGEVAGATLNLYWHNQASGLTDLSAFYVVDRATSVFKIDYPQNMLTPGKVTAYIQILHGGKVTHTKPFEITVQNLAGTTRGVLATAEYSALVTALAKANEFSAQLAHKVNKGEAREDTTARPIDVDEMNTRTKQLFTGGAVAVVGERSVGNENVKPYALEHDRLSFTEPSKNLFNKKTAKRGHALVASTGQIVPANGQAVGELIEVEPNTRYTASQLRTVGYYDSGRTFISAETLRSFTTPENVKFVQPSILESQLDTYQLEKGSVKSEYEEYGNFKLSGKFLKDKTIEVDALSFLNVGKNLFNKDTVLRNTNIDALGEPIQQSGTCLSDFIEVEAGQTYTGTHLRPTFYYDYNQKYVSQIPASLSFTPPVNIKFARKSILESTLDTYQLEKGKEPTSYEPYRLYPQNVAIDTEKSVGFKLFDNQVRDDIRTKNEKNLTLYGHTECIVPAYDGKLSVCHPSVAHKENGWNGYKYWMGMTPYPGGDRENPCVLASNDKINWETPKGLVNPIFSLSDAVGIGMAGSSDTDILFSADGSTLMLYWRSMGNTKGESINLATSTDGINWTIFPRLIVFPPINGQIVSILSPTVVLEDDGTFGMWSVNQNGTDRTKMLERRTSADGKNWSDPIQCNVPNDPNFAPYHPNVHKFNGVYHMLIASNSNNRLRHLTSHDGINWTFNPKLGLFPLSGFDWDKDAHYRSCFLPKSNGKFDMWINGIKIGSAESAWSNGAEWRIAYYRDVDLNNGIIPQIRRNKVFYGNITNAPSSQTGYLNGDRYEYTDPIAGGFIGKILVDGVWKDFGAISV